MFWKLTLREVELILTGATSRSKREHNERAWQAWHTAYLSAYAPDKSREFIRLDKLLFSNKTLQPQKPTDWQDEFDAFAAWAASFKGKNS